MIVIPSLSNGTISSYGTQRKLYLSYKASFNYGFDLGYYNGQGGEYLYQNTFLCYLKIDNKVLINDNDNYLYGYDDYLDNAEYRDDGYGVGPVGCIDLLNNYIKNTFKNNDFQFYVGGDRYVALRAAIGRKMIITLRNTIYKQDDYTQPIEDFVLYTTLYINFPVIDSNEIGIAEGLGPVDPAFNGIIDYASNIPSSAVGWS